MNEESGFSGRCKPIRNRPLSAIPANGATASVVALPQAVNFSHLSSARQPLVSPTTTLFLIDISEARLESILSTGKVPPTTTLPSTVTSFAKRLAIVSTERVLLGVSPLFTTTGVAAVFDVAYPQPASRSRQRCH